MKNRSLLTRVIAISLLVAGSNAIAHDPALHAKAGEEGKAKPATCQQLNDPEHYEVDMKDAFTKSLKERCDARKKAKEQQAGATPPSK